MEKRITTLITRPDRDLEIKGQALVRLLNETIQHNANELSLGFYRIQEHTEKTMPAMIQKRHELENLQEQMNGLIFDVEYDVAAAKVLTNSNEHINNIIIQLEKALLIGKEINLYRQQHVQQQLFEKQGRPLLSSSRN